MILGYLLLTLNKFHTLSCISIADFGQVNADPESPTYFFIKPNFKQRFFSRDLLSTENKKPWMRGFLPSLLNILGLFDMYYYQGTWSKCSADVTLRFILFLLTSINIFLNLSGLFSEFEYVPVIFNIWLFVITKSRKRSFRLLSYLNIFLIAMVLFHYILKCFLKTLNKHSHNPHMGRTSL